MHAFARREDDRAGGEAWAMSEGRAVHAHMKRKIQLALGDRSWKWLAEQIGVPQSTLAGQVSKPRFSLDVAWKVARVLDLDLHDMLGLPNRETDSR